VPGSALQRQCPDGEQECFRGTQALRLCLPIPAWATDQVNEFAFNILSPYVNYHRPCLFPREIGDDKGRLRKRYPYQDMMAPYEKLKSLPEAEKYLKPGITLEALETQALAMSDHEADRRLNRARNLLF